MQSFLQIILTIVRGGMCYSNTKDSLTSAIERKNEELSDRLVDILRTRLRSHYTPSIDELMLNTIEFLEEKK